MFTGIVEREVQLVELENLEGGCRLGFNLPDSKSLQEIQLGDSVCINGVCLTVMAKKSDCFYVVAVPETLRLTNLGELKIGSSANFERSMLASTRIGGHWVQGHIDGVVEVLSCVPDGVALNVTFSLPEKFKPYLIYKGFVGLDGMSLTIAGLNPDSFWVTLIPHTREVTIAKEYQVGRRVNFEADMMAKYVERIMEVKYAHAE